MAKAEWGLKRNCLSCGARFYDMGHSPIICPKCGATVEPEAVFKSSRRASPAAAPEPKAVAPVVLDDEVAVGVVDDEVDIVEDDEEGVATGDVEEGDEEEGDLIEDASDLGEDDDDMAEVMEHLDDLEDEV